MGAPGRDSRRPDRTTAGGRTTRSGGKRHLPDDATTDTTRTITTVAEVGYEQLFRHDGDGRYVHDFGGGLRRFSGLEGTDVEATARGEVSISPVTPLAAASFPAAVVDELLGSSGEEERP